MSLSVLLQVRISELRLCPTCTSTKLWYYKTCNGFKKQKHFSINIIANIMIIPPTVGSREFYFSHDVTKGLNYGKVSRDGKGRLLCVLERMKPV